MRTKGVSAILVSIFLVIIAVSMTYGFLVWSQSAQRGLQENIGGEAERRTGEAGAGLSIVAVADNQLSVKNTGRNILDATKVSVLLDGKRVAASTDKDTVGPADVVVINVTKFVPGVRDVRIAGPLGTADESLEPVLYPGTAAFWDFLPEDESAPRDASAGGSDGVLTGTTVLALHLDESRGNIVKDASVYANDGTLQNGVAWSNGITRSGLDFDGVDDRVVVLE
ncbi:MAG: hypothetical protein HY366_01240, partial [Candidatus Aenigmarchaeota archaeon]|nr:hypothetical protein [Candidatus Aenigmarchaeota archaeon]